jgi:putative membrane protein
MKSNKKTRIVGFIIIIAVIVLPLAYSLFYLGAFWDPYGKLNQLPIAVVNNDSGATINGETRNLGSELVENLKTNDTLKWTFTDEKDAEAGVQGKDYYAMVAIPSDFSSAIASADKTDKQIAQITYTANEKRNYLASQILNRAILELEVELRAKVNEEIRISVMVSVIFPMAQKT